VEIRVEVESPEALLALFYPNGRIGGLTVPGKLPGGLGEGVELTVAVRRPPRQFALRGQLAWVRHKSGPNQPAGYGVDFAAEETTLCARMLAFARREVPSKTTRAETRHRVELAVRLVHDGRQRREFVADLSTGGAFILTWNPLPVDSEVVLFLKSTLGLSSLEVTGKVAWVRLAGEAPGMGIAFKTDPALRSKIGKLLQKFVRSK
jgi:Tfp pilus assembly protein PilZ